MTIEQLAKDFLKAHEYAYEIVMDTETNLPVKAIYKYFGNQGESTQEAVYWFREEFAE